jgi:hypothetical protein
MNKELIPDIHNIIGEYCSGDKNYWKTKYDNVIKYYKYSLKEFNFVISEQIWRIHGEILYDICRYSYVKYFMRFLKMYDYHQLTHEWYVYKEIFKKTFIFNKYRYNHISYCQVIDKEMLHKYDFGEGCYLKNLKRLRKDKMSLCQSIKKMIF